MKITEIKKKSKSELRKLLNESKDKLGLLRFDLSAGKVKNVREIREVRKRIAKILTILKEAK